MKTLKIKTIASVLALTVILSSLAGCGKAQQTDTGSQLNTETKTEVAIKDDKSVEAESAPAKTEEAKPVTEEPKPEEKSVKEETSEETTPVESSKEEVPEKTEPVQQPEKTPEETKPVEKSEETKTEPKQEENPEETKPVEKTEESKPEPKAEETPEETKPVEKPEEKPEETKPEEKTGEPEHTEIPAEKTEESKPAEDISEVYTAKVEVQDVQIAGEIAAIASAEPAVSTGESNFKASGTAVKETEEAVIDYSNMADGYVMVQYKTSTDKKIKVQLAGPTTTYTYNIKAEKWETFSLTDGNGTYKITVFKNVKGSSYATVISEKITVSLKDEFGPFLHSNQYVNYDVAKNAKAKAKELTSGKSGNIEKVAAIYDFVISTLSYDTDKASNVSSGYLPDIDKVLSAKKGICFDYAALMTGMLRSCGVPCKLVVGYAGSAYHAWISVYSNGGWVNGVVFFDGTAWQRMDPTFASSGNQSEAILKYIGDGSNYSAKYFY